MKSHLQLLQSVLADASTWCSVSTTRDYESISRRVKHEGFSFLTITLSTYCRDFERSLDLGYVDPTFFSSFKKRRALPQLLGGLLDLVFDRATGTLLAAPNRHAVFFIRQISLLYKKILLPCTPARNKAAFDAYYECEREVKSGEEKHPILDFESFDRATTLLFGPILSAIDRDIYSLRITPKHGPGSTSDRITANAKFELKTWHSRLEDYFPSADFLIPNSGFYEVLQSVDFLEPGAEIPPRVITVPKTLKTPRIIAIEPTCMQYAQQALLEVLVNGLERSDYLSGAIGFTDQTPNREFARIGSEDGSLATIDLSEASDRVSNQLVKRMLASWPSLSGALQACRSTHVDLPGYGKIAISKFASMGSATCFPIEAMVFLNIVVSAWLKSLRAPPKRRALTAFLKRVRIYGDDIIVPVELAGSVVRELSYFNMKVNVNKSFWTGKFRESCGKDYYGGDDVTVTYVRREFPTRRSDAQEMISLVSLRNQMYSSGLWKTTAYLDDMIRRLCPLPIVESTSPIIGRHSFLPSQGEKMCPHLHRPLVKGLLTRVVHRESKLDDYGALMKFFLKRGLGPYFDAKHLERYGRPLSVDTKIGWAPNR
ncbi:RNA-directed RNA polymerase [ssRNA phage SRR6960509_17]|uniref:RNA-directed RNA polymerase n=1 Tax=ssRNA phage SRR6960509_17 TaxID=2786528 RepID=A0A8S5L4G2_9VIRU|nr:RNA-directed RNA polymerase [ssRNA phage SRR6960509_17]DAD52576.1 TPA_asm: RNA-directed RNA polymerase [ssRNA phage SRR6960509_17]